jgi:hypothetical protein
VGGERTWACFIVHFGPAVAVRCMGVAAALLCTAHAGSRCPAASSPLLWSLIDRMATVTTQRGTALQAQFQCGDREMLQRQLCVRACVRVCVRVHVDVGKQGVRDAHTHLLICSSGVILSLAAAP